MMRVPSSGGGWAAIAYSLRTARHAGGWLRFWRALRSRNACKTCALGMGGQRGGMVNEAGRFPEVCKKSMQAMAADMRGVIGPGFFARWSLAELETLSPRELEALGRIGEPLLAGPGDTHFRPIGWDEALDLCVARLRATAPDDNLFYFSGRASNEAAFLWQLFARQHGTNNVNNCSYYCHQASGVGLKQALGSGTATITLDDLEACDFFMLLGGNPASNHPRLMTVLADIRRRGGEVIVVNPLREAGLLNFRIPSRPISLLLGSPIASRYVQPHIGGDLALLTAIARQLLRLARGPGGAGAVDPAFIAGHTDGFDAFAARLANLSDEELEQASGVSRGEVDWIARRYADARAAVFGWTMGITHHEHGVENVRAITNLALLRGMVGRPHAGLLPIRGHSNVQGVGSMGVAPELAPLVLERLERDFGMRLPRSPGLDTLAAFDALRSGRLRNLWCLGGNLFGASPDAAATRADFARAEFVAYFSTTLNTGHVLGRAQQTLILPVRARDEESQPTTQESMFNFVRLSEGGPQRVPGARSETELVAELARRVLPPGGPLDWTALEQHAEIRRMIAAVIPGYEAAGRIDATRKEFQVAGRTFHQPPFPTPTGRASFAVPHLPLDPLAPGELRLMTIRSEGQFNTVVYEEEDIYRGQERRDVILMSPQDIARLGLRENQPVSVRSRIGEMHGVLVRPAAIRAGNAAMYYPESNVLVPRTADAQSRTPAFKNVRITVAALARPLTGPVHSLPVVR